MGRFDVERADLALEAERARTEQAEAAAALDHARQALESTRLAASAREAELAAGRARRDELVRQSRTLEQGVAALEARLASLKEMDAARAEYGDAARLILAESNGAVGQLGSSPTASRSSAATSAPSRRGSATCSSTCSSGATATRPPA